ncbi:hypothetical protein CR158_18785 [Halomonas heilongjiangensis]|nr:hypothetical protein CR158_18785 [Halomonas heilongjiangensis]
MIDVLESLFQTGICGSFLFPVGIFMFHKQFIMERKLTKQSLDTAVDINDKFSQFMIFNSA